VATVICPRECLFADNQCSQATPREQPADSGDVVVTAAQLVVANNRADGGATAIRLSTPQDRAHTVLGNLTRGQILVNGGPLSSLWAPLNVVGV
jgi:hypothetical protein